MKLIGSKIETEYREELIRSHRHIFTENTRLMSGLRLRYPNMRTAYILGWTPEQGEDIYRVLVDTDTVAAVELPRGGKECDVPIEEIPFSEYEKSLSRTGRIKLAVAIDLARSDIKSSA